MFDSQSYVCDTSRGSINLNIQISKNSCRIHTYTRRKRALWSWCRVKKWAICSAGNRAFCSRPNYLVHVGTSYSLQCSGKDALLLTSTKRKTKPSHLTRIVLSWRKRIYQHIWKKKKKCRMTKEIKNENTPKTLCTLLWFLSFNLNIGCI